MTGTDLVVHEPGAGVRQYRASTDAAGVCGEIVKKTAVSIKGRKYVKAEGWQAIAAAHGCIASAGDVRREETGYSATGKVIEISSGRTISSGEGFVGDDEEMWAKRPEYAKRAMAQTRAISRACRSAFAFVVVMIDENLSTTPAEEVPADGFDDREVSERPSRKKSHEIIEGQVDKPQKMSPQQVIKCLEIAADMVELDEAAAWAKEIADENMKKIARAAYRKRKDELQMDLAES